MNEPARPRRNQRPRDELGQPLPYGEDGFELPPLEPPRTPADALRQAQGLLDANLAFYAHEVLEDAWKVAPADEREFWQGLAQLAVGRTHIGRGNLPGAITLLGRAARKLTPYRADSPHGVDVEALLLWAEQTTHRLEADNLRAITPLRIIDTGAVGQPGRRGIGTV